MPTSSNDLSRNSLHHQTDNTKPRVRSTTLKADCLNSINCELFLIRPAVNNSICCFCDTESLNFIVYRENKFNVCYFNDQFYLKWFSVLLLPWRICWRGQSVLDSEQGKTLTVSKIEKLLRTLSSQ